MLKSHSQTNESTLSTSTALYKLIEKSVDNIDESSTTNKLRLTLNSTSTSTSTPTSTSTSTSPMTSVSNNKRKKKNKTHIKFAGNLQMKNGIEAESYKPIFFDEKTTRTTTNQQEKFRRLEALLQPTMLAVTLFTSQHLMTQHLTETTPNAFNEENFKNNLMEKSSTESHENLDNIYSYTSASSDEQFSINSNSSNQTVIIDANEIDDETINTLANISHYTTLYYVPLLFVIGSIGNIFSMVVFSRTKLKKLSSSYYLSALAISDTCYLLCLFIHWLNFIDIDIYNRQYFCQSFTYTSSLSCFCSSWFVVAFTVERFIAVMYPLRRQTMCTIQRAKHVLTGLTVFGIFHSAPFAFATHSVYSPRINSNNCDINSKYQDYMSLYNYWDSSIVYAIPFAVIIILNSITAYTVCKFAKLRRAITSQRTSNRRNEAMAADVASPLAYRMITLRGKLSTKSRRQQQNSIRHSDDETSGPSVSSKARFDNDSIQRTRPNRNATSSQAKVTKMLLIVSTVFVLFNAPSCVLRIMTYKETQTATNKRSTIVMQYIFQLLFMTNFGINFILYCVSGKNFREAVSGMLRRSSTPQREAITQVTVSEYCRPSGTARTSTRRRIMSQNYWNEMHELQPMKPAKK